MEAWAEGETTVFSRTRTDQMISINQRSNFRLFQANIIENIKITSKYLKTFFHLLLYNLFPEIQEL